jgi:VCBS repeat-containing protein
MHELHGIPCEYSAPPGVAVCDDTVAMHAYQIAREALVNSLRHAQANCVRISLETNGDTGTLTVADDGAWRESDHSSGVGLRIMHHRATLIDAELTVRHSDGAGTTVVCTFPNRR